MEFGILALLPPVVAIILAILTRNVVPALFAGVFVGATMINGWNLCLGCMLALSSSSFQHLAMNGTQMY